MKVIFLDIDGVINPQLHMNALHLHNRANQIPHRDEFGYLFCPHTVENLEYIVHTSGAKIVVSSTWRLSGLQVMKDLFKVRGIDVDVHDITPRLNTPRGEEIAAWLGENDYVTKYVILDDDSDMLPEQLPYFVQTTNKYGLTRKLAEQAINILTQ